jgi:LuxR family maltose regulon positive regulatory protein
LKRTAGQTPPRFDLTASSLTRAKIGLPASPAHYVRRPRLLELLDEMVHAPLTLVVAPAGTGKTSLMSGWVAESELRAVWLSLDDSDRDAAQFWSDVIAALETIRPGCGQQAAGLLRRPGSLADAVGALLDGLRAGPTDRALLIIDDMHVTEETDALVASLSGFLRNLPPWLRLVLVSRRRPNLPLDRLRARGQLGEIGFAELRFATDEAKELLCRLTPSLSEEAIEAAAARAAGWATSLHMAALAARSSRAQRPFDIRMDRDDVLLDDYVWHEVLAAEAPELVQALIDISVAERVTASLAGALTGRPDAGELLVRAEARGLFVTRLGPEGWFELHSLARAALLAELRRRSPGRLSGQHAIAARWFEEEGEVVLALDHWLAADRPGEALRLLAAKHGSLYDSGRASVILRTVGAIPAAVANTDVPALLEYAWCHLLVDRRRFLELVDQATWWAQRSELDATTRAHLTMLESMAATISGRWAEGGSLARRAMLELGDTAWRDPLGRFGWNMVARDLAMSESWDDSAERVREAERSLGRDPERRLAFEGTRALGEALAGQPVDALRVAAGVRHAAAVSNMAILRTELAFAEALSHRELGDRGRALPALAAIADDAAEPMLYARVVATLELVQACIDDRDLDAAHDLFTQTEELVVGESLGPDVRNWLGRVGTILGLAAGDVDEARRWSEGVDDPFWSAVSAARVHLAEGRRADALGALETAVPRCVRHEVLLDLLRAQAVDDHDEALKHVTTAVDLAVANGLCQTVASADPEALRLIERAAWRAPERWLDRVRRAAVPRSGDHRLGRHKRETLTEREREVLRFLPSRLTLAEIADELYISVNTLKFHLKVIYRKLGVSSRSEAAEVARHI